MTDKRRGNHVRQETEPTCRNAAGHVWRPDKVRLYDVPYTCDWCTWCGVTRHRHITYWYKIPVVPGTGDEVADD